LIYCQQLFSEFFIDISFPLAVFEEISILTKSAASSDYLIASIYLILGTGRRFGRWLLSCCDSSRFSSNPVGELNPDARANSHSPSGLNLLGYRELSTKPLGFISRNLPAKLQLLG